MTTARFAFLLAFALSGSVSLADEVDIPNQFSAGTPAVAADVNENFSAVEVAIDDNAQQLGSLSTTVSGLEAEIAALETENASLTQLLQSLVLETSVHPSIDTTVNINDDQPQADNDDLLVADTGPFETSVLLRFDLTHIPAGATIEYAELRMWLLDWPDPLPDLDICVYQVTSDWDETVRFSTAPTQDSICLAVETVGDEPGLYYWSGFSSLVQTWIDGDNFGLALALTGPDVTTFKQFYSNEGGIYKPELQVRYGVLQ
ncbi:MAG: DNRLRE domain-containing protein [Pseudomonadota bacterium]